MTSFFEFIFGSLPKIALPLSILQLCLTVVVIAIAIRRKNYSDLPAILLLAIPAIFISLRIFDSQLCGPFPKDQPGGSVVYHTRMICIDSFENLTTLTMLAAVSYAIILFIWNWVHHKKSSLWLRAASTLVFLNVLASYAPFITLLTVGLFFDVE